MQFVFILFLVIMNLEELESYSKVMVRKSKLHLSGNLLPCLLSHI
uniref:Uncharacterized protein n=1 Tax=Rhizophora mucronata TaxID=61149 RepID=A0A2P2MZN2_RHIMU